MLTAKSAATLAPDRPPSRIVAVSRDENSARALAVSCESRRMRTVGVRFDDMQLLTTTPPNSFTASAKSRSSTGFEKNLCEARRAARNRSIS